MVKLLKSLELTNNLMMGSFSIYSRIYYVNKLQAMD